MKARRAELVPADRVLEADAGWLIGQMYLRGELTYGQREAGAALWHATRRMQVLLAGPRPPRALALGLPRGRSDGDDPDEYQRVCKRYKELYAIVAVRGWRVRRAVADALRDDEHAPVELVREGLEALRVYLKLPNG